MKNIKTIKTILKIALRRVPMLWSTLLFLRWKISTSPKQYYLTMEFFRSYTRWCIHNPKEEARFSYELPSGANILDVGGFAGDSAARFIELYDANVTVFEPIPKFASQIKQRFAGDTRVCVYQAGLSDKDEVVEFNLNHDGSGAFGLSSSKVEVALWDVGRFLSQSKTVKWDLAKINIEGGEYALLSRLIDTGRIETIKYLTVQFHLHTLDAEEQYKELAKRLANTHTLQWRYPFVWESWVRKEDGVS